MWIFTKDGFFSVVAHNEDPDAFLVRARDPDDIGQAMLRVGMDVDVVEDPYADYRWRARISRDAWSRYMVEALDDIDYTTNVKGTMAAGDRDRSNAYFSVWRVMNDLQEKRTKQRSRLPD